MANENDMDSTQVVNTDNVENVENVENTENVEAVDGAVTEEAPASEVPQAKTKKEIKKERKEIKKHKKEVAKEAKLHSARRTKAQNFWLGFISIVVIISMCASVIIVGLSFKNIKASTTSSSSASTGDSSSSGSSSSGDSSGDGSGDAAADVPVADTTASSDSAAADTTKASSDSTTAAAASGVDLKTKAGIVDYYKKAHAKVLTSAKTVTRTYDNTTNYKEVLEIGDSSVVATLAKSLMGQFLKENTTATAYTSASDIAANFPPAGGNSDGLTADMISTATCTESGDHYVIKLTINSTESAYDKGDKTKNLCTIVAEDQVTSAAKGVTLSGLENRYIGANITANVDKATGNLTYLETIVPSYMCFTEAKVAIVSVKNCRIGLEYHQKWTAAY